MSWRHGEDSGQVVTNKHAEQPTAEKSCRTCLIQLLPEPDIKTGNCCAEPVLSPSLVAVG